MPLAPQHHRNGSQARPVRDLRKYTAHQRGYDAHWQRIAPQILTRMVADTCNPRCRYCELATATMLDHALPPGRCAEPGSDKYRAIHRDERYLVPCCSACNSRKRDLLPDELEHKHPGMYMRLVQVLSERRVSVRKAAREAGRHNARTTSETEPAA